MFGFSWFSSSASVVAKDNAKKDDGIFLMVEKDKLNEDAKEIDVNEPSVIGIVSAAPAASEAPTPASTPLSAPLTSAAPEVAATTPASSVVAGAKDQAPNPPSVQATSQVVSSLPVSSVKAALFTPTSEVSSAVDAASQNQKKHKHKGDHRFKPRSLRVIK